MMIMGVLSSLPNSCLFSCIITLYLLLILYLPSLVSFTSAIFIIAPHVLLSLFHQRVIHEPQRNESTEQENEPRKKESCVSKGEEDCSNIREAEEEALEDRFIKWDVRAPLEVIYEMSEEDEERSRECVSELVGTCCQFLSLDDEDDVVLMKDCCFFRLEEDETELIEIHLDDNNVHSDYFYAEEEEDGFIEIDIATSLYRSGNELTNTCT